MKSIFSGIYVPLGWPQVLVLNTANKALTVLNIQIHMQLYKF